MGCDVNLMHACMRTYGVCARILNGVNCVPIMRVYLSVCVCVHACSEVKNCTDVSDYTSLEFDRWQVWLN